MFYYLIHHLPLWSKMANGKRNVRTFLLGTVCYILFHAYLFSAIGSKNPKIVKFRPYIYYLWITDAISMAVLYKKYYKKTILTDVSDLVEVGPVSSVAPLPVSPPSRAPALPDKLPSRPPMLPGKLPAHPVQTVPVSRPTESAREASPAGDTVSHSSKQRIFKQLDEPSEDERVSPAKPIPTEVHPVEPASGEVIPVAVESPKPALEPIEEEAEEVEESDLESLPIPIYRPVSNQS